MNASRTRRQLGISLVESLVTVAISGVLLGVGVPGFSHLVADSRLNTEVNTFLTHVHLARSEAVKRGVTATLCPSADGEACLSDPEWHRGYMVFIDQDGDRTRDEEEPLIRRAQGAADAPVLVTSSRSRRAIRFRSDGSAGGSNLSVTFCETGGNVDGLAVVISNVGRPRVTDKATSGRPISCS